VENIEDTDDVMISGKAMLSVMNILKGHIQSFVAGLETGMSELEPLNTADVILQVNISSINQMIEKKKEK